MNNLQKYSKFYRIVFQVIFLTVLILVPLFWIVIQTKADFFSPMGISQSFTEPYIFHQLSFKTRFLALLASLIPTLYRFYIF